MKLYATIKGQKQGGQEVEKSQGSNGDMRVIFRDESKEWFLQVYVLNENGELIADIETGDGEIKRILQKIKGKKQKGEVLPRSRQLKSWPKGI